MADIVTDSRLVSDLLHALQKEGVRADNRERLRGQLAEAQQLLERLSGEGRQPDSNGQQVQQVYERLEENLRFAREAQQLLEHSIFVAQTFISVRLRPRDAAEQAESKRAVKRARPVQGNVDYARLSREHMARYPKIRARLAE